MSKTMFKEETDPIERLRLLRDNCDTSDETSYIKSLTQPELDFRHESLADNCITKNELEEELKKIKKSFKDQIDPLNESSNQLCREIKTRQAEVKGELFHFKDFEEGMLNTFDQTGEFVSSRRLKPEEKQAKLFIAPAVNQ